MKFTIALLLLVMAFATVVMASDEYKGAENLVLQGGQFGNIFFPHKKHHGVLNDCNLCHNLFPKIKGSIARLKAKGSLRRRQVMGQCTSCHFARLRKGQKAGPTSCGGCHKR